MNPKNPDSKLHFVWQWIEEHAPFTVYNPFAVNFWGLVLSGLLVYVDVRSGFSDKVMLIVVAFWVFTGLLTFFMVACGVTFWWEEKRDKGKSKRKPRRAASFDGDE